MTEITIALDAMGGDHGPSIIIPAALKSLRKYPKLKLILVGEEKGLKEHLRTIGALSHERLLIHHASQTVGMDELPSQALRNKKDSSMRVAINLVKELKAQACVSAGNTGALIATARFVLKTLPGIDRPALISELPTLGRRTRVLDLGANIDSYAENLFQFAVMGSVLAAVEDNIESPSVGLLNIGAEEIKGNDQVKQAAQLLTGNDAVNYIGFVEGDDIFKGLTDIIVCDGFVGNIALKASEGTAQLINSYIKQGFKRNFLTKLAGLISYPVLKMLEKDVDPARYNGASILGLNGIVIKSHGSADVLAYSCAIDEAIMEAQKNIPLCIGEQVAKLLNEGLIA